MGDTAGGRQAFLRKWGCVPAVPQPQAGPIRGTESDLVRVQATADEAILVGGLPGTLEEPAAILQAAIPPAMLVKYSDDNPEIHSEFGSPVIECRRRLGLPIAFDVPPGIIRRSASTTIPAGETA